MSAIELTGISVAYDGASEILKDISLSFSSRARVAVMGPSGSGKSSLLKVIAGLIKPTEGTATGNGAIGYLPQDSKDLVLPWKPVSAQLSIGVARELGLEAHCDHFPHSLSGGQLRRLALGDVLQRRKQIYLLDEPLTGLDVDLRQRMADFIDKRLDGSDTLLLFITHYIEEAHALRADCGLLVRDRQVTLMRDLGALNQSFSHRAAL